MITAERVPEPKGAYINTPLTFRKKDQAGTAEKDLTAAALSHAEEDPSAG
jgi:hypothetical protein